MFGYPLTELTGQPLERLIPAHLQAARARPVGTGVLLTGLRKDGATFPVEISLSPVQTASGRFSLAVVRDMTAVRSLADVDAAAAAAQQMHRSREVLDTIITHLYQVGVSLQTAADLPRDTARPHLEEAARTLDDIISQIRDSTFAARGRTKPWRADRLTPEASVNHLRLFRPRASPRERTAFHPALFAFCPNVRDGGPVGLVTSGRDGGGGRGGRLRGEQRAKPSGPDRPASWRRHYDAPQLSSYRDRGVRRGGDPAGSRGLLLWGSTYVHNTVQGQLASQQIFFPPKAAFAHPVAGTEITPR